MPSCSPSGTSNSSTSWAWTRRRVCCSAWQASSRRSRRACALRFAAPNTDAPFLAEDSDGVPALTDLPALLDLAAKAENDTAVLSDLQRLVHVGSTSIDGTDEPATPAMLLAVAPLFRLKDAHAREELRRVAAVTAQWQQSAAQHGLNARERSGMSPAFDMIAVATAV